MSNEAVAAVWNSDINGSAKLILLRMADYADSKGRGCYASVSRLQW